ncbi:SAM-dependent methyltransferase [Polaromonas eurypsychrophila]|uniref:Cyclopropane-fatty-acyl-phospholipid synthase n=1 Tax=Polaromonas eurypsychrophila TaxID=1614635 RepID=A0A916S9B7_9BURK|nr:cyclopropane-fatty-acyl-phospholipid synthase family protein [Polaromonas eurypsychrophila]GGA88137.1 cyclopropane-fatty-acyl-phospholipid synthase [Polaromonas eurypsychrophila]
MNTASNPSSSTASCVSSTLASLALPGGAPAAARTVLQLLTRLKHGTLHVQLPDGSTRHFGSGEAPVASLRLHNWNVCGAALKSGDIGFAESFIAGDWTTQNLNDLLSVLIRNRQEVEDVIYGTWLGRFAYRIKHLLNRNTKTNSQKNIHAHYDLGNAFYELWLDGTMNYSSAIFATPETSMKDAQDAKVRRALRLAGVKAGDRVLEIGCGWGALAEMAATEFDASIVGVTLSTEQLAWAQERLDRLGVRRAGLPQASTAPLPGDRGSEAPEAHAVASVGATHDLRLQDYRDIGKTGDSETFDAICSIEMVEAVGREYWPDYFQTVARLLKPGGRACIQSIVIADNLFERYVSSTDFIQQYIFPGGCLPCPKEFRAQAKAAGLEVIDEFSFGQDYAHTLKLWRDQFMAQESRVLQLGFDKRFIRIWEFYLAYCEAAFTQANTDVVQYTLRKS